MEGSKQESCHLQRLMCQAWNLDWTASLRWEIGEEGGFYENLSEAKVGDGGEGHTRVHWKWNVQDMRRWPLVMSWTESGRIPVPCMGERWRGPPQTHSVAHWEPRFLSLISFTGSVTVGAALNHSLICQRRQNTGLWPAHMWVGLSSVPHNYEMSEKVVWETCRLVI